jgi:predicted ATPase
LLLDAATLHLLITSRQRLALAGEQVFELAGLPVPTQCTAAAEPQGARLQGPGADERLSEEPAVALFVDRARAASPDFVVAGREPEIGALVRLLGGMPLAIELAASRMRGLSPRALLALLTERGAPMLDLLSREGGGADMAQRHASMRHVVDWSWRQLGPAQAELMQALSAFAAPAGADTVAAVAGLPLAAARERLEQLRDHSLAVAHRVPDGEHRYVLLQPVREFVIERTDGQRAAALRERHRLWLIDFGHRCAARAHAAIDEVETEMPLVQAAILDAVHDGPEAQRQAVRLAVALRRHWEIDTRAGLPMAMVQALDACLAAVDDDALRSEACALQAYSKILAGMTAEALAQADEAVRLAADPRRRAQALMRRVQVAMFSQGDQSTVDAPLAEAVALAERSGDRETQALALRMHYLVLGNRDRDRPAAEAVALKVQHLWESLGHRRNAYGALMDRASCWLDTGRLDEAAVALAACERVAGQERFATGTIMSSWMLGRAQLRLRQPEAALAAFRRCLDGAWAHKRLAYVADALVQLPGGLAFTGQIEDAARLLGFAIAHWQRQFGPFYRGLELDVRPTRRWLRQRLGAVRYETLRLEGACLSLADAVALGLGRG